MKAAIKSIQTRAKLNQTTRKGVAQKTLHDRSVATGERPYRHILFFLSAFLIFRQFFKTFIWGFWFGLGTLYRVQMYQSHNQNSCFRIRSATSFLCMVHSHLDKPHLDYPHLDKPHLD